jgi:phosphate transport system protein
MPIYIHRELENLKKKIFSLCAVVEESVQQAVQSLENRDVHLAESVISNDEQVDRMEVDLEEECLKILALYQPVAIDLRFIISVLKMNNDLERIADLAVNIAERAISLAEEERIPPPFDYHEMAIKVQTMLKKSLDSLVNLDAKLARQVCALDDEVDAMLSDTFRLVKEQIRLHLERIDPLVHYLSVARHLERIADLATNIAEDVMYMIEGEIVRHRI